MQRAIVLTVLAFTLNACDMFTAQPQPFPVWSPVPTRTPGIVSPTPIIIGPTSILTLLPFTPTDSPTPSITSTATPVAPSATSTPALVAAATVDILGCNTGFDITHGMGEVTNAFVTLKNSGNVDLPNACALLRASDEDRQHPDKIRCVPNLPVHTEVTLKLTVDSAFKVGTAIQVDATSNGVLLLRVDRLSCTDIAVFGGEPSNVGEIKPQP